MRVPDRSIIVEAGKTKKEKEGKNLPSSPDHHSMDSYLSYCPD